MSQQGVFTEEFFPVDPKVLSPNFDGQAEDQTWLNDLLAKSAPVTTSNSFTGLSNYDNPKSTLQILNQPIDFARLFESDSLFSTDGFVSSSDVSSSNSPNVKVEPEENEGVPDMAVIDNKLRKIQSMPDHTPNMLETIFDTKDILKQEQSLVNSPKKNPAEDINPVLKKSHSFIGIGEVKKPTRRRTPRKRLTETQKEAHNKIEKKYRININAKIAGLQKIIPWVALDKTAFETGRKEDDDETSNCSRLNKSIILEKATDYILYMQQNENRLLEENRLLKRELEQLRASYNALTR